MRALHRTLMDKDLRGRMKERGYKQAARFSWETSVRRILEAYGQIAHGGRSKAGQQPAAD
jgi:glycosyltransferase involved in cell wall biosynthesis